MPKYGYLVVEGPHDVEFAYRLLSPFGLERVRKDVDLDPFFGPLIPTKYPPEGDLQKRMPIPLFLQSQSHVLAIHHSEGDSQILKTIRVNTNLLTIEAMTAVGVLLDSDATAPADRYTALRDVLRLAGFPFPDVAGAIAPSNPRFGGFVLPDNQATGTLESILLECAGKAYPGLLAGATTHVDAAIGDITLVADDRKDLRKPNGRDKAIIASMAAVLRPGKAVQTSIQDNRWLRGDSLEIPRVKAVQSFLADLFGLSA